MPAPRCRAAVVRTPGGASSLLRLSGTTRLPSNAAQGQWLGRAARALHHEAQPLPAAAV